MSASALSPGAVSPRRMDSSRISTTVKCLKNTTECIFYEKLEQLQVDATAATNYESSKKFATLLQQLKEKGPLIAFGQLGPEAFQIESFKLTRQVEKYDIYGWRPDAPRTVPSEAVYVMVIGAIKEDGVKLVYFTMSAPLMSSKDSGVRTYNVSHLNPNIYVVSYRTFHSSVISLYTRIEQTKKRMKGLFPYRTSSNQLLAVRGSVAAQSSSNELLEEDLKIVQAVCLIDPSSIRDIESVRKHCKDLGQKIYDAHSKPPGNHTTGMDALNKAYKLIWDTGHDGPLRKQYVEFAWKEIKPRRRSSLPGLWG